MTAVIEKIDIDEFIHSMSPEELWAMSRDKQPIQINVTQEEFDRAEKIYELMDLTDLEYTDIECILYEPQKARLCDIKTYCKALNINVLDFIQKIL